MRDQTVGTVTPRAVAAFSLCAAPGLSGAAGIFYLASQQSAVIPVVTGLLATTVAGFCAVFAASTGIVLAERVCGTRTPMAVLMGAVLAGSMAYTAARHVMDAAVAAGNPSPPSVHTAPPPPRLTHSNY